MSDRALPTLDSDPIESDLETRPHTTEPSGDVTGETEAIDAVGLTGEAGPAAPADPTDQAPADPTDPDGPEGPAAPWAEAPAAPRRRRGLAVAVAAALVLLLGSGGFVAAQAHKDVTIEADGAQATLGSWRGSVAGLLEDQGIVLGEHDEVLPSLDTPLVDGIEVVVLRAQPIDVVIDGQAQTLWTTADNAGQALASTALEGRETLMAVSRSAGRAEMDLPISGALRVVTMDGETEGAVPSGTTLQVALDRLAIEPLGDLDEIAVTAEADGTTVVTIVRVVVSDVVEVETVAHTSREVSSDRYYEGTTRVTTEGVDGSIERTYAVTTRDGVEVSRELASEVTTQEMVQEVVTRGTKARPAVTSSGSSSSGSSGSTVSGDVWSALAQCESGGNPSIVSSNGKYHGLYQFTVSTWQSVGGSGLPSEASASEQTERAKILQARSGWGQWPACARKLGLL